MSDLLNSASLVMIPSGYKEDVVYSQIPTDGSGDLSFTRASNGTRVNSAGLVEVCPWNLVGYSEQFDNAYWTKNRSSITADSTTAPNGTTTADSLIENTANGTHEFITVLATQLQSYNFSIYAKANTRSKIQLVLAGTPWTTGGNGEASFDLSLGTVISAVNGATGTIESVGNGWYRCTIAKPTSLADPSGVLAVRLLDASGNSSYTGNGTSSAYLWGAQLNIGSTAKPYFPTTDRLNVPRLTYQNGGGGCPSLLLEKQSTNGLIYSEVLNSAFTNQSSAGTGAFTITQNYGISPDGTQNADRIQMSATGGAGNYVDILNASFTGTTGVTYTYSVYIKSLSGTPTIGFLYDGTANRLVTLTNDWVRYTYTFSGVAGAIYPRFLCEPVGGTSTSADILVWGWQIEASSYPTSYIPTTSSSATRVADECRKGGVSSLIGQTEGTIFGEILINPSGESQLLWQRNSTTGLYTDFIYLGTNSDGYGWARVVVSGNVVCDILTASPLTQTWHKFAFAYKQNDFVLYIDGVNIGTDTNGNVPSGMSEIYLDQYIDGGLRNASKKQFALFKTRLTNAELAQLTA